MIIDLDSNHEIPDENYRITVVGAGIAGLSLAIELEKRFQKVLLLETGGLEVTDLKQQDHGGKTSTYGINVDHGQEYLLNVTQRWFGGTSHWAGVCRPFDNLDFEERHNLDFADGIWIIMNIKNTQKQLRPIQV